MIPLTLITALIAIESGGNDTCVGDSGLACGCLQIHREVIEDVNRITGRTYTLMDRFDRAKSIEICQAYLGHYATAKRIGRDPTLEDMARIWNGGPNGWLKMATIPYWQRAATHLPT